LLGTAGCNLFKEEETRFYTIEAECESGVVTPQTVTKPVGTSAYFTFVPQKGYKMESAYYYGENNGGQKASLVDDSTIVVSPEEGQYTLRVYCEKIEYTIRATTSVGGDVSPRGTINVSYGESKTFTATSNTGFSFIGWLINNDTIYTDEGTYIFSNIDTDYTISPIFKKKVKYTIIATDGENSTISPSGTFTLYEGESKTFKNKTNLDYNPNGFVVNGSYVAGDGDSLYTVTTDMDYIITTVAKEDSIIYPLCHGVWKKVYLNIGGDECNPEYEIYYFYTNGKYKRLSNTGTYSGKWTLDKKTSPMTLKCGYGTCLIDLLNTNYLVVHYLNYDGLYIYMGYENIGSE